MNPMIAAGILAAAYKLGLLPKPSAGEVTAPVVAAAGAGYVLGNHGKSDLESALQRSEITRLQSEHEARMREALLKAQLQQQEQLQQAQRMQEALHNAAIAAAPPVTH